MENNIQCNEIPVGVVGLGMMGCSIATCFLIAGHQVRAIAPIETDLDHADPRISNHLERAFQEGLTDIAPASLKQNLVISTDYTHLADCKVVVECTIEDLPIKRRVYQKIEGVIDPEAILTSNTSAIPISILQKETKNPQRFFGLHWAEPSHTTRFLEVICGEQSDLSKGQYLYDLAHHWQKEPTLVRKDIRGFIGNRLMYAMYREACWLVENGYASIEDVDRACRNNTGYWMTLVGVFGWMDLTGVPAYHTVMKDLLPTLCNQKEVPKLIDDIVKAGGKGLANGHGFYTYTDEEKKMWEEVFTEFTYDIRKIALKYPADVVEKRIKEKHHSSE